MPKFWSRPEDELRALRRSLIDRERRGEFLDLSSSSCELLEREFATPVTAFAPPDDLAAMRKRVAELRQELDNAVDVEDYQKAIVLRDEIRALRSRDPAEVALVLNKEIQASVKAERHTDAERCRNDLQRVRRLLPKFNLEGLWKGFYPNHGDVTVRLQYDDTEILATKVEGGGHVPVGEVTFRADVADAEARRTPNLEEDAFDETLDDLNLDDGFEVDDTANSDDFTVQCLSTDGKDVEQYKGMGRVARSGFRDANFVPGRLFILGDDAISFIWLPLGTVVVFKRVSEWNPFDPKTPSPSPDEIVTPDTDESLMDQTVSIAAALDNILKGAGKNGIFDKDF
jgi:hypothetical protein